MISSIVSLWNKPFPEQEGSFGALKPIAIISIFVTLFLFIFQPFGIHTLEKDKFLICLGFGVMTFLASAIYELIVSKILNLKGEGTNWTFGKWSVYNLGVMLCIALANFLFARLALFGYILWDLLPQMIYSTFMIGIIPILGLGFYALQVQERKYLSLAENMQLPKPKYEDEMLATTSVFGIPIQRIRYIQGMQNYVHIGYVDQDDKFQKRMERATLKQLEELSEGNIVKSHRSFLVNPNAIISFSGNAQGLLLQLCDSDRTIPVSRRFVSTFRNLSA